MFAVFVLSSLIFAQGNGGVGEYENMSIGLKATGQVKSLKITKSDGKNLSFELAVASQGCNGKLTTTVKMENSKGHYRKGKCQVDLNSRESGWFVEETGDCSKIHGPNCNFSGLYAERPD